MRVAQGIDQLHIHPDGVTRLLYAPFENVCHTELLCDVADISRFVSKLLCRSTRDHFEVTDLRQPGEDLILDAFAKISVIRIVTQVLEGQNGDRLAFNRW